MTFHVYIVQYNSNVLFFLVSIASDACDFDSGNFCEWYQPAAQVATRASTHTVNIFQWGLGKGASIHPGGEGHRPLTDHTT